MRLKWSLLMISVTLAGCANLFGNDRQQYSIFFQPYSTELDTQAQRTAREAAQFAKTNPNLSVTIAGYSAPADPARDVDGLSADRAQAVKGILVADGIDPQRIDAQANGTIDPKTLPSIAVRRVDITFAR